jgi:hypothetical protein
MERLGQTISRADERTARHLPLDLEERGAAINAFVVSGCISGVSHHQEAPSDQERPMRTQKPDRWTPHAAGLGRLICREPRVGTPCIIPQQFELGA